ncbi:MAG: hypothetical protein ACREEK_25935 [Bradyrhizobium sp.]
MKRQQHRQRCKLSEVVLPGKISRVAPGCEFDIDRRPDEYGNQIQNRSKREAEKQAPDQIGSSRCEHGGHDDRDNDHDLLRESDER